MPSLNYYLDRTRQSTDSIKSLVFGDPGIFTNSFIKKPPITDLLKDAAEHEQALYTIKRISIPTEDVFVHSAVNEGQNKFQLEANPERIDGKSYYVNYSFNDYTNLNITNTDINLPETHKRTAVRIPMLQSETSIDSNPNRDNQSSPIKLQSKSQMDSLIDTMDVRELCDYVSETIRKYPNLFDQEEDFDTKALLEKIRSSNNEYISLKSEIEELEEIVNEQRRQLQFYNISIGDRSPLKHSQNSQDSDVSRSQTIASDEEIDIDELIREEEEAIRKLKETLSSRQANE